MSHPEFTQEQKQYLDGFVAGAGMRKSISLPMAADQQGPADIHRKAQDRFVAEGKKLVAEEQAKRAKNGLGIWDEVVARAREGKFPKGTGGFLFQFQGLFYGAPAPDSFLS